MGTVRDPLFLETHEVCKVLRAFFSWLCCSGSDWLRQAISDHMAALHASMDQILLKHPPPPADFAKWREWVETI